MISTKKVYNEYMIKNTITVTLVGMVLLVIGIMLAGIYKFNFTDGGDILPGKNAPDVGNMSYTVHGEVFTLKDGMASNSAAPGSSSVNTLKLFGQPIYHDFNNDGKNDAALMLVETTPGSGTFYYAVLAIAKDTTYIATNALLLGDRIAPQNINIESGRAVYNYAERNVGEPMTTQPSLGKSLYIQYVPATNEIGEWVKNFEGESSASTMKLDMKTWVWTKTQMNNGSTTIPKKDGLFTITFKKDGTVAIGTDCNKMGGTYTIQGNLITFSKLMSTLMYCEGSQEQDFSAMLENTARYLFTNKGELVLELKMDSGTMTFK